MKSVFITILSLYALMASAQSPWTHVTDETTIQKHNGERAMIPKAYDTYALDLTSLKSLLSKAPMAQDINGKKARLALPVGDGIVETFEFVESPAMSPVLSAKFPAIKSYKGISLDNPHNTAWIDFSQNEFRGIINKLETKIFIDPYYRVADGNYVVYHSRDEVVDLEDLEKTCGVTSYEQELYNQKPEGVYLSKNYGNTKAAGLPVTKITYRFAVTSTGLWTAQQGNSVNAVLARINTAANRLNSIFEPEMAIKFELVDNNDELIFFTNQVPLTPFSSEREGRVCLRENSDVINRTIGQNSYDMGHCFTVRCTDGVAGVANLGSVCNERKGNGVSCVGTSDIGNFMLTVAAHELGHQFTTGHTWGSCPPSQDQFSGQQNCEPGSGSTIMSYFNLCGAENLNAPYSGVFHTCSLIPITNFVNTGDGSTCGNREVVNNSHPDVFILDEPNTIPVSTPFELIGDATDMEDDELTFVWEQIDGGTIAFPLGSPAGSAPAFRTFPPSARKSRVFPRLSSILVGSDNGAERLPTYERELNFALTVRDNNPTAGGINWETIKLDVTEAAGPFVVTTPSVLTTASVNEEVLVEWDVAGTDGPEVDCQFVDIYFSPDNGVTFETRLLNSTPNDGSAMVRMPNELTTSGKIKVKAADNVFFNINRNTIRVVEPTVPSFFVDAAQSTFEFCLPNSLTVDLAGTSFLGYSNDVQLDIVSGLPAIASHNFSVNPMPADGTSTLSIDMSEVLDGGTYNVVVRAIGADADTIFQNIVIDATGSFLGDVALQTPADDTRGLAVIPEFTWAPSVNASSYLLEISSSPDFSDDNIIYSKNTGLENIEDSALFNLENSTLYFWRVTTFNDCVGSETTPINIFSTQALNCRVFASDDVPLNIPSGPAGSVTSEIDIAESGMVSDVNVELVKGSHNNLADIRASIVSPQGTNVVLWQGCTAFNRIDAGFDDAASIPNDCPDKNGLKIRPRNPLSAFIGQELQGKWLLKIDDVTPGNGGTIDEYQLELCSSTALFSPVIVLNEVADVAPGRGTVIVNSQLLAEDENNEPEELIFTIMEAPARGDLIRNGTIIGVGDQFTQRNIDRGLIVYKHNGTQEEADQFTFIVEDGEGGWVNRTNYNINVIEGGSTTAVEDIERAENYFDIFPNPATDQVTITQLEADNSEWKLTLTANGQLVTQQTFQNGMELNVSDLPTGLYLIQLQSENINVAKKISIVK
jgi:subtilisin-like proprotein convertase family protein